MKIHRKHEKGRVSLTQLKAISTTLTPLQQRAIVGGVDINTIYLNGGGSATSYNWGKEIGSYTVVTDASNNTYYFDGVSVSSGTKAPNGAAMQVGGVIYEGDNGINMNTFIHEYGHFLQQETLNSKYPDWMASVGYLGYIGGGSGIATLLSNLFPDYDYYSFPTEKEASELGQAYMDYYYPDSNYIAP